MASKIYDKHGNEIWCEGKRVYLRLKGSSGIRCLGVIDDDTFHTQRKVTQHVMHTQGDVGFNYALIKRGKFKHVEVEFSDGRILLTSREEILKHGDVKNFKGQGYELQVFLPIERFRSKECATLFGTTA